MGASVMRIALIIVACALCFIFGWVIGGAEHVTILTSSCLALITGIILGRHVS